MHAPVQVGEAVLAGLEHPAHVADQVVAGPHGQAVACQPLDAGGLEQGSAVVPKAHGGRGEAAENPGELRIKHVAHAVEILVAAAGLGQGVYLVGLHKLIAVGVGPNAIPAHALARLAFRLGKLRRPAGPGHHHRRRAGPVVAVSRDAEHRISKVVVHEVFPHRAGSGGAKQPARLEEMPLSESRQPQLSGLGQPQRRGEPDRLLGHGLVGGDRKHEPVAKGERGILFVQRAAGRPILRVAHKPLDLLALLVPDGDHPRVLRFGYPEPPLGIHVHAADRAKRRVVEGQTARIGSLDLHEGHVHVRRLPAAAADRAFERHGWAVDLDLPIGPRVEHKQAARIVGGELPRRLAARERERCEPAVLGHDRHAVCATSEQPAVGQPDDVVGLFREGHFQRKRAPVAGCARLLVEEDQCVGGEVLAVVGPGPLADERRSHFLAHRDPRHEPGHRQRCGPAGGPLPAHILPRVGIQLDDRVFEGHPQAAVGMVDRIDAVDAPLLLVAPKFSVRLVEPEHGVGRFRDAARDRDDGAGGRSGGRAGDVAGAGVVGRPTAVLVALPGQGVGIVEGVVVEDPRPGKRQAAGLVGAGGHDLAGVVHPVPDHRQRLPRGSRGRERRLPQQVSHPLAVRSLDYDRETLMPRRWRRNLDCHPMGGGDRLFGPPRRAAGGPLDRGDLAPGRPGRQKARGCEETAGHGPEIPAGWPAGLRRHDRHDRHDSARHEPAFRGKNREILDQSCRKKIFGLLEDPPIVGAGDAAHNILRFEVAELKGLWG